MYTIEQALLAVSEFLNGYYFNTFSDDLGSILGDMYLLPNGNTMDRAFKEYWIEACTIVMNDQFSVSSCLTSVQAFDAMRVLLVTYSKKASMIPDLEDIIHDMRIENNIYATPGIEERWLRALAAASSTYCISNQCASEDLHHYTSTQIYSASIDFIKGYYYKTFSSALHRLITDMTVLPNGNPTNALVLTYWKEAWMKFYLDNNTISLTLIQSFIAMIAFLERYNKEQSSQDIIWMLYDMHLIGEEKTFNPEAWDRWKRAVRLSASVFN